MTNETVVPQLRFPEFNGNWKPNLLGEIATFSKGKGISKSEIDNDGEIECVRYGELYTEYSETISTVKSRTNVSREQLIFSEANDVIIPASGETQIDIATASCILRDGIALGSDLNIIKSKTNGVFLSYYLNNGKKKDIAQLAQGISVVHLYASQLKELKLTLPKPEEQTKIADFIAKVDNQIQLLEKEKTLLEKYKKGISQKIFDQEVKFKDDNGNDFPDWDKMSIYEIGDIKKGEQLNKEELNNFDDYPSISGGIEPSGYTNKHNRPENTIIISEGGNSCGYVNFIKTKFWCGGHCYSIDIIDKSKFDNFYLFQLLKFKENEIMKLRVGSGLPNIQKKDLNNFKLILSSNKNEQTKIVNFLSNLDNLIEKTDIQISKSKSFKKGLLQKMFV